MLKKFLILLTFLFPSIANAYECNREIDNLSREYQIPIHCRYSSITLMDDKATGQEPRLDKLARFVAPLEEFFSIYGKRFIKSKLNEIVLLENLKLDGFDVGGLSNGVKIYICIDNYGEDEYNIYLRALHHEFSSTVYKSYTIDKRMKFGDMSHDDYDNSDDFLNRCLSSSVFGRHYDTYVNSRGFIFNYGRTNIENDFNTYAETLFQNPSRIKKLSETYPKIKIKLKMLKEFYRGLGFTQNFPDET